MVRYEYPFSEGIRTVPAGSLSFVDRGTFYYYLPAWDPDLATLAPSSLLLAQVCSPYFLHFLQLIGMYRS